MLQWISNHDEGVYEMGRYDVDFKREAVKRVVGNNIPAIQVARELGVSKHTMYSWLKEHRDHQGDAFVGSGNLRPEDKMQKDYEKRIRDLEEENAILKKAAAIFVRDQKR